MISPDEIKKKLAKLAAFEAVEEEKNRWLPFHELQSNLRELYQIMIRVENAAMHAEEAEEILGGIGIDPPHWGYHASDELWDAHTKIEHLIEKTEKESETLFLQLSEEEE